MLSLVLGLLGGIGGWVLSVFFGKPLVEFLRLRTEVARLIARFERASPDEYDEKTIANRTSSYQQCGAELIGFADSNAMICRMLGRFDIRVREAGQNLVGMAGHAPSSTLSLQLRKLMISSLRLNPPEEVFHRESIKRPFR